MKFDKHSQGGIGRVRLSNLANLENFLSLLLEGMHGEATQVIESE